MGCCQNKQDNRQQNINLFKNSTNIQKAINYLKKINKTSGDDFKYIIFTAINAPTIIPIKALKQYSEDNSTNNYTFRDFSSSINMKNANGDSPMHILARRRNLICIDLLKSYGGNINLQNNQGDTPFMIMKRFDIDISC